MNLSLEERKLRYIETVNAEHRPKELSWWQYPGPVYYRTKNYAFHHKAPISAGEPIILKHSVKEKVVIGVLFIIAILLILLLSNKETKLINIMALLVLLIIVLPKLLNNKPVMNISKEGIWLYREDKDLRWKDIVFTQIKEVEGEDTYYYFIVHYYNESVDEFQISEIALDGLISPAQLSATIEAYRSV
jgi:hypothetical protein